MLYKRKRECPKFGFKADLGFELYVPDCDTTACSFSAATQFGSQDEILDQPLIDFYAGYQIGQGDNLEMLTVPINDNIEFDGGIVTWIENQAGDRPYGNDLDPTLNLDVLELCFRNCERWQIVDTPHRLATIQRIIHFQRARTSITCRSCTARISAVAMRRSVRCRARNRTRSTPPEASS